MSRSYKKTPYFGDKSNGYMKKQFNRKLRHRNKQSDPEDESNYLQNKSYRKANESWEISDYGWIQTWEEYWQSCISNWKYGQSCGWNEPYPDRKQEYKRWKKMYKNK